MTAASGHYVDAILAKTRRTLVFWLESTNVVEKEIFSGFPYTGFPRIAGFIND